MKRCQGGVALLLVLWATILLAGLLAGVAAASRSHSQAAVYGAERVRAQLAAEAGLAHAVAGLRAPDLAHQWVPDGRPHRFVLGTAKVTVAVVDVGGMVDLNAAPPQLLAGLFAAAGVDQARAVELAQTLVLWRASPATAPVQASGAAQPQGADVGEAHGPFRAIEQLARVPGVDMALYARVADAVTVFSGRNFPDASYAGPVALAAARTLDVREARQLVEQRRARLPQRGAGNGQAFGQVQGGQLVAGYGGVVERVFSVAEMPDGTRAGVDVTVRMALTGTRARPYKVLTWRSDIAQTP